MNKDTSFIQDILDQINESKNNPGKNNWVLDPIKEKWTLFEDGIHWFINKSSECKYYLKSIEGEGCTSHASLNKAKELVNRLWLKSIDPKLKQIAQSARLRYSSSELVNNKLVGSNS